MQFAQNFIIWSPPVNLGRHTINKAEFNHWGFLNYCQRRYTKVLLRLVITDQTTNSYQIRVCFLVSKVEISSFQSSILAKPWSAVTTGPFNKGLVSFYLAAQYNGQPNKISLAHGKIIFAGAVFHALQFSQETRRFQQSGGKRATYKLRFSISALLHTTADDMKAEIPAERLTCQELSPTGS